jgi:hypothetical protein
LLSVFLSSRPVSQIIHDMNILCEFGNESDEKKN